MARSRHEEQQLGEIIDTVHTPAATAASGLNPFVYLERNAASNPRGVFVATPDQQLLNSEAVVLVKQIAYELRRLGVVSGNMVALELPEFLRILFIEALFHEAVGLTMLPKDYSADGVFQVDWIFSSSDPTPQVGARVVTVDAGFLGRIEQNPYGISPRAYPSDEALVCIWFSSGTTGRPNAIARSLAIFNGISPNDTAGASWLKGDPLLMLLDTGTPSGLNAFWVSVRDDRPYLAIGGSGYDAIADFAFRKSVTTVQGAPVQLERFVTEVEALGKPLSSVDTVFAIGTVMPPALANRLRAALPGCVVYNIYGSTEGTLAAARFYESDDPFDAGAIFSGSIIQIVDEDDNELADGQVGRIRHRHPQMAHEYLGDPEASAKNFLDDWFYPGDLGLIRLDGGLTLAGRSSEILNAGGVKFDPVELDLYAMTFPGLADACSFSYTASNGLQQVGIALVAADGFDVQSLVAGFTEKFGGSAPQLFARADGIPRNAMGKPIRRQLSSTYNES